MRLNEQILLKYGKVRVTKQRKNKNLSRDSSKKNKKRELELSERYFFEKRKKLFYEELEKGEKIKM